MRTKVLMMRVNITRLPSIFLHSSLMKWRHSSRNLHHVETRRSRTLEVGVEAISVQTGAASSTRTIPSRCHSVLERGTGRLGLVGRCLGSCMKYGVQSIDLASTATWRRVAAMGQMISTKRGSLFPSKGYFVVLSPHGRRLDQTASRRLGSLYRMYGSFPGTRFQHRQSVHRVHLLGMY